jgi:hypothetical protein
MGCLRSTKRGCQSCEGVAVRQCGGNEVGFMGILF